ncbi:uncharacterized protein LOC131250568 [Magnolia sinica]|uniref:uncharacterized protein LOC131250568 n=1 Tax=Magnolia sinica TaxID=86752 RepID=UPI0026595DDF|nr:uncharacterized protein LOC131250568 [Magnolia sinica]
MEVCYKGEHAYVPITQERLLAGIIYEDSTWIGTKDCYSARFVSSGDQLAIAKENERRLGMGTKACLFDCVYKCCLIQADKLKKSLEDEIHFLKGRVSELESDFVSKSPEVTSTVLGKEEALLCLNSTTSYNQWQLL